MKVDWRASRSLVVAQLLFLEAEYCSACCSAGPQHQNFGAFQLQAAFQRTNHSSHIRVETVKLAVLCANHSVTGADLL